ncbi:MAG: phage portal protein, partial [Bacteroidales bacterium]|nr:phage portal protein [Bacteroidales bacterium]
TNRAMLLSCVYRCVEVISDSVAQLPLEPYRIDSQGYKVKFTSHPTYRLLNSEPNARMTRFTFIKTLIVSTLLKGNGFAYIERDGEGNAIALHYIPSDQVTINPPATIKDNVTYSVVGFSKAIEACNMIHILNLTYDGVTGLSTLAHAKNTLGLASDSEAHASGFFRGGANLAGILTVQGTLTSKQKQDLKSSWQTAFSPTSGQPNGVAVLEGNMEFKPITVNPTDAQLLETREFNVIDICRFFGVSPVKAFDLSKSSYSTVEATNISFLTDTLSPLLEKIELEMQRKLYKPSEKDNLEVRFDTSRLLRADKQSLANYYNTLFNIGVVSCNEIRREIDLPYVEGGDAHFVQCNLMEISNAANNTPTSTNLVSEDVKQ